MAELYSSSRGIFGSLAWPCPDLGDHGAMSPARESCMAVRGRRRHTRARRLEFRSVNRPGLAVPDVHTGHRHGLGVDSLVALPRVIDAVGIAEFQFAVPNDPALIGVQLFAQGIAQDPPANAFGFVFTNGVEVGLGGTP